MDMQSLINALAEVGLNERSKYHLTLGELITKLKNADKDAVVEFDEGGYIGGEGSYRGYYSDLAFELSSNRKTVKEFLAQCEAALGSTYEGYKGGDFIMGEGTPLWISAYGNADAIAIIGVKHNLNPPRFDLITKRVDE